ncbi:hypothetical protein HanOQP8_Chr01g0031001 [Helianthus annuus]|nr:hypothetical protein HanOQP8_Chr01g0031001 [Helianthus annuus]
MKRIELFCNACVRPIMEMPFYKCSTNEDESCNFALHEWCTRLPSRIDNHPDHPHHTLHLMSNVSGVFLNIFSCSFCYLRCNGFAYCCFECGYKVDVTCGLIPKNITHESHPKHLLSLVRGVHSRHKCIMCLGYFSDYPYSSDYPYFHTLHKLIFNCSTCEVYIHPECALLLPGTIRHPYDKHPMNLSYLLIENHKSEYFCEVCENELNPHACFYHCDECSQSLHSACAPAICCETTTYSDRRRNISQHINLKFGSIHKIDGHSHPLLFAQGIKSDGQCSICSKGLRYMILKCLQCKYAIDYECCERLNLMNNS